MCHGEVTTRFFVRSLDLIDYLKWILPTRNEFSLSPCEWCRLSAGVWFHTTSGTAGRTSSRGPVPSESPGKGLRPSAPWPGNWRRKSQGENVNCTGWTTVTVTVHWFCHVSLAWLHSCLLNVQKRLLWIDVDLYDLLCRENTCRLMTVSKLVNGTLTVNCILLSAQKPWLHIYGLNITFVIYLVPKQRVDLQLIMWRYTIYINISYYEP